MGQGIGYGRNDIPEGSPRMAELLTVYEVRGTTFVQESGQYHNFRVGYALSRGDAEALAQGQGAHGDSGSFVEHTGVRFASGAVFLLGQHVEVQSAEAALKAKALAKLTPEERRILGLPAYADPVRPAKPSVPDVIEVPSVQVLKVSKEGSDARDQYRRSLTAGLLEDLSAADTRLEPGRYKITITRLPK